VPVTYVYDGHSIFGHTKTGLKTSMMDENESVCFEVDHVENLANWQSVIAQGKYEELTGKKAEDAMQMLVNRVHPYVTSDTSVPRHGLDRPHSAIDPHIQMVVFRIKINDVTGRYEKQ
jgi:nitroimidazol reductase NimA-like FMN-containing flavoprotein (pyridoxamine 5'-phosphate oxidase superfamily)